MTTNHEWQGQENRWVRLYETGEQCKAALDAKFTPQPTEHKFATITVYKLGDVENQAYLSAILGVCSAYYGGKNITTDCRESAEKFARAWVIATWRAKGVRS
jgi:hypothetical protein